MAPGRAARSGREGRGPGVRSEGHAREARHTSIGALVTLPYASLLGVYLVSQYARVTGEEVGAAGHSRALPV